MTQEGQVTQNFLEALLTCDESNLQKVLDPDATLRIYGHQGMEVHRSLTRIAQRLTAESAQWSTPWLEIFTNQTTGSKTAVEFRIQATENGRYIEHNRAAFFTIEAGHIKTIEMYCPEPIPSAHRKNHIASADLSDQELTRLFDSYLFHHDVRMGVPPGLSGRLNLRCLMIGRGGSHPDENTILGVRWTAEEADAKIQSVINHHKEKGIGFTWSISPYDTPSDLAQRLEKHGLILAGEQALMALTDLETLEIATNPDLEIIPLDITDDEQIEATLQVVSLAFQRTREQIDQRRPGFFERTRDNSHLNFLAYLNGRLVGHGRIDLSGSTAHLSGAATLPDYRGRGIYSTLLHHRLNVAREFGHQIATIDALPMSKPIVARHGFKEYATTYIYAWMPVIDMDIINGLIQSN